MRFEAATIKDIAKALGLSTSTISRGLRDSYEISEATKQLILDYAKKIHYKPNPIALSLQARKSKSIGVIVAEIANNFFSQVINGIESVANHQGYNVVITQSLENYQKEVNTAGFLASGSIDGCLVSISSETTDLTHFTCLQDKGFPIVFFDRIIEKLQCHTVTVDNVQGAYEGTMHLLKNNYRKIGFIANSPGLYITVKRLEGYKKALAEYGINFNERMVRYCMHGGLYYDEAETGLYDLLNGEMETDAVFASTDKLTICCVRYCQKHGIPVPQKIAIAGFSNMEITDLLSPSLTVIRQPAFEMGKIAAELLLKAIESKRPLDYEQHLLPVKLSVGGSSSPKALRCSSL